MSSEDDDSSQEFVAANPDGQLDADAWQNLYDQMFDLYLEDALQEKGLDESELEKAQIVFVAPFQDNQFEKEDRGVQVRINDEVEAVGTIKLDTDREIEKGDPIYFDEIERIESMQVGDFGEDVGHVTFIRLPDGSMYMTFDFVYNKTYLEPVLDAADQFLEAAEYCREQELWRGFVENAFHAAERLMKHRVIMHGKPAYDHRVIQSQYRIFARSDTIEEDLYTQYNQLKDKYRMPASYVNPGDHPDGVDEKAFKLEETAADDILEVLTTYRDSLESDPVEDEQAES